jgi:hypothetical protein
MKLLFAAADVQRGFGSVPNSQHGYDPTISARSLTSSEVRDLNQTQPDQMLRDISPPGAAIGKLRGRFLWSVDQVDCPLEVWLL